MRLYWSSRSPFVRKVTMTAHEKGLLDRITLERVVVSSSKPNPLVMADNPTGRIPTLVLDDATALFDSRVICEFLDASGVGPALFPPSPDRWQVLCQQALGDGLMEISIARLGERNRSEAARSQPHLDAHRRKSETTLERLEAMSDALASMPFSIGAISIGCALAYLDFRFADDVWRNHRPGLTQWHAQFSLRASAQATAFSDVY